jgi:chromosome segregation ATPase
MLHTNIKKIIELHKQYIDKVNLSVIKLDKQIQFLIYINEQLGGNQPNNKSNIEDLINKLSTQDTNIIRTIATNQDKMTILMEEFESIVDANTKLITLNNQLTKTNDELTKENNELTKKDNALIKANNELTKENNKLPQSSTNKLPQSSTNKLPEASTNKLPQASTKKVPQSSTNKLPQSSTNKLPEASTKKVPPKWNSNQKADIKLR